MIELTMGPMTLLFRHNRIYQDHQLYEGREQTSWPALVVIVLLIAGIMAMIVKVYGHFSPSEHREAAALPAAAQWLPREDDHMFSLSSPEFGASASERLNPGQTLRTTLVQGGDKKFIRMAILRTITGQPSDFYLEMVRRSADAGFALLKSDQPQVTLTRFGRTEAAQMTISGPQGALSCFGIRALDHLPDLQISGLICGASASEMPDTMACMIERLNLNATNDSALADMLSKSGQTSTCKKSQTAATSSGDPLSANITPPKLKKK